ncbi:lamin tail domain-containing protein [Ferruginibacter lapsinanis]|uniref:lamin tail domain-containing protein n=1 Tax=Ferruginibacter lapsinanis TaxID=563172 RepID=UPI001E3C61C1|nr:lamin tail domain-containing protein [Ferruginibacter lapsinanis]UEG48831.1 lamin tail domain-containing protein [Ferruginibacter lapsinanis]
MRKINLFPLYSILIAFIFSLPFSTKAQIVISQYYEGTGTNKWIELTNLGNSAVNTASPQLKLGLWAVSGSTGNITFTGAATNTYNLTVTIPAKGSVLIGNTGNGTEVTYLTAGSANETSNSVINFNGNDGVALLDASGTIIDKFGEGINAADISYVRSTSITAANATYTPSEWTSTSLATVQGAATGTPQRLGYQLAPLCIAPTAQATALSFSSVTSSSINGSFTAASGADGYVVVMSTSSTLSANPVDGTTYTTGNSIGGGTVINAGTSTSFSTSGLSSNTIYYFFVFDYTNTNCTGGPKYLTTSPLNASQATPYPPCVAPTVQATALNFSGVTSSSINGSFTSAAGADGYVVVMSTSSSLTSTPVDGTSYSFGNSLGGGTVVHNGSTPSFSKSGLSSNTTYYFFVFDFTNTNCTGGPKYLTTSPLTGNQTTAYPPCVAPTNSATAMTFSSVTSSTITTGFTIAGGVDGYLVIRSTASSLSANPVDATTYTTGNTIGGGTVISVGTTNSIPQTGLAAATTYYYYVFSYNNVNCTSGPVYKTTALTGSKATDPAVLSYYFGNLHSHSSYSDGNSDDVTKTPADDYAYAKNAMCMDFLGISEHNHAGAGMLLADWQPGATQAAAATTSSFVALHGQEWGVIGTQGTNGDHAGHVIVYGLDSLAGWETNNYQIYVPKSTYLGTGGLFDIINRHGNNAFASLAHPDNYDYNNILNTTYDVNADNAIAGSAIESGPAFSADTTYTNPASIGYYAFYKNMLAKGYHMGPTIDHDNHNLTFGHTAKTRLAIMAYTLSETNILDAMRKMRFYATEDCAAKIGFTINTSYPIGSIITKAGTPTISVTTNTTNTVSSIKLMYGVPGSGSAATTLTSTTASSLTYTHTALANLATGYYFLDITESNGARVITAPIWYTRDDGAQRPAFVTSLFTINEADKVILKWTATHEPANEVYEIQRSIDGRNFITIGTLNGKGNTTDQLNYAIEDRSPYNGLAYYRLAQKNATGNTTYSELQTVNRTSIPSSYFVAYFNQANDQLNVKVISAQTERTRIDLLDITGRIVKTQLINLNKGEQNIQINLSGLIKGTYVTRIQLGQKVQTQMLNKF